MHRELPESCEVHSHEGEKCAKVEELAGVLIGVSDGVKQHCANKRQAADDQNVVRRRAASRTQVSKNTTRQNIVSSHSKEQTRRAEPSCQAAAEGCQYQNRSHGVEEHHASDALTNVHERGFQIGKRVPVRPNHLREINEQPSKDTRECAYQHSREQDVALRILHVFGKCSDSVEAYIGKRSERGCAPDAVRIEGLRIVEWPSGEHACQSLLAKEEPDRQHNEKPDDDEHQKEQDFVCTRRRANSAQIQNRNNSSDNRRPGEEWY